nr:pentatricopeptide repeat-containing protein At2g13600-like [Ipomoea batatas]
MQQSTEPIPCSSTHHYSTLLTKCIQTRDFTLGRLIHSRLIKTALTLNTFLANRLIHMYAKFGFIHSSHNLFNQLPIKNTHSWNIIISAFSQAGLFKNALQLLDQMPEPNLVTYNSIISSLSHRGHFRKSIGVFKLMQARCKSEALMDGFTAVSLANVCACLGALKQLCQLHGVAIVIGLEFNAVLCNALIDAYGKCCLPQNSYFVFRRMHERDVVSWTSMLAAYARASRMEDACRIFHQMPLRNVVSWTALIGGFAQNGEGEKALCLFRQMQEEGIIPSAFTYVSVLTACADIALLDKGKQVHSHIIRHKCSSDNICVVNALVDMYCKCGDIASAMTLFERFPDKDTITWNSLITGLAQNGHGEKSLSMFKTMIAANVQTNHVTFLGALSACNHCGLESEGFKILNSMETDHGVHPGLDHYSIMIDLLGRKNRLTEAAELIERAADGSDHIGMWGAVLGACRVHGNVELARRAAEALFELEPENTARYVMLSNVYAAAGRWDDVREVRTRMDDRRLHKEAAFSWIEIKNVRYKFVAKDKFFCRTEEIQELLHKLGDHMKDAGYVPNIEHAFSPKDTNVSLDLYLL